MLWRKNSVFDFARIALGGDFYPLPGVGFGPYLELDLGTYLDLPGGSTATPGGARDDATEASVYAFFGLGARLVLDPVSVFRPPKAGAGTQKGAARISARTVVAPL